jgi:hypothetical protein
LANMTVILPMQLKTHIYLYIMLAHKNSDYYLFMVVD